MKTIYKIVWDNGHSTGSFPEEFTHKKAAEAAARDWKREMVAMEPPETRDDARYEYSWEIIAKPTSTLVVTRFNNTGPWWVEERFPSGEIIVRGNVQPTRADARALLRRLRPLDFKVHTDVPNPSVYLLRPFTPAAEEWVNDHIDPDAPRLGNGVAVEHRYVAEIVRGIQDSGLTVE